MISFKNIEFPPFSLNFQGEELAGAPLMCQAAGEWHLVGVSAWRKGCSGAARQRPRLYDRVSVAARWAHKTMEAMDEQLRKKAASKPRRRQGRRVGGRRRRRIGENG